MAGDWIKVEHTAPDKPEVYQIAGMLGIDPDAVTGKLLRLWIWCDQQTLNGNALGVTEVTLDRIAHQPGFSDALRKVGWLQVRSGSLVIPNFDRHNGQTAKARASANRRVAKHRAQGNENVTLEPLQKPLPEKRREEFKEKKEAHAIESEISPSNREDPQPPSLAEIKSFAMTAGIPPECCDWWFNEMEGLGWRRQGQPIRKWRPILTNFARRWQAGDHLRSQSQSRPLHQPPQRKLPSPDDAERQWLQQNQNQ